MKADTNIKGINQGIIDNQSVTEIDEIVEQIKMVRLLRNTGDVLKTGTDKYIITVEKIE